MVDRTPLAQLKAFLNQLFQFDSQDLDFGVYKILHYKKKEIAHFIDHLLVDKVQAELQTLSGEETQRIEEQLSDLTQDGLIKGWLEADETEKKTLEKFGKDKISRYKSLKAQVTKSTVSAETENQIYNHLTLFFSRYYDKGDFISKRRFGKNEKYVVPYNGEETHFHWANQDQYYIKSSETFNHYAFKVQTMTGTLVVNFKLHNAQLEQGNVKAEEKNFFLLSERAPEIKDQADSNLQFVLANKPPDVNEKEVTFYFEYRPLGEEEKKQVKGNNKQDSLDELAFAFLQKEFRTHPLFAKLWKPVPGKAEGEAGKPLLLQKLQHYTRKNKHDFFIHKNLKSFLERELDYYIKSELIEVEDLYVSETEAYFDRLKHRIKTIKVFKAIADTIIDFVSQIEDFQKKLWEKKKFVLSTEWVITIDRLVEYVGEEAARPILEEVIKNEKQVAEWKELFGEELFADWKGITLEELMVQPEEGAQLSLTNNGEEAKEWRKLPVDTRWFGKEFKLALLNQLSNEIGIDDKLDGAVMHSDNFHGLRTLQESYKQQVQSIYIDPPYNTSASEIIYKNSFKHSSWISLLENRFNESIPLLGNSGILCCTIDDFEYQNLIGLMDSVFKEVLGTVSIRIKPSGRPIPSGFALSHEYAIFAGNSYDIQIGRFPRTKEQLARYRERDENGPFFWEMLRKAGSGSLKSDRPTMHFPLFLNDKLDVRVPKLQYDSATESYTLLEKPNENEEIILPRKDNGELGRWYMGYNSITKQQGHLKAEKQENGAIFIYYKRRPNEGVQPTTVWTEAKYSATEHGTALLKDLFNEHEIFSYPKSVHAVYDCIWLSSDSPDIVILDYFPGSGTTFHATQMLNRDDKGNRKCILIEQGEYIHSVILPRIKKIAYTFDWKDGKPKDGSMNGLGVFFKYQRLEQYEEALENIAFHASEDAVQQALAFEQYIPKYFLEFETRGSQTLVNTAAMQDPWDYQLKVWDGFTYDTEQAVDLVETFNYLIGLHMQKCITKELNGKKYQFVYGHNNANKQILVVWRSVKGWTLDDYAADAKVLKSELAAFAYDLLYLNDQAHLEGYQPIEEVFKNKMLS